METIGNIFKDYNDKSVSMPMVALRGLVIFPQMTMHFDVGRQKSIKAIKSAMEQRKNIFLSSQIDMECDDPRTSDVYPIGVVCEIKQVIKLPGTDALRVVVDGLYRAQLLSINSANPFLTAIVAKVESKKVNKEDSIYEQALVRRLSAIFEEYSYLLQLTEVYIFHLQIQTD